VRIPTGVALTLVLVLITSCSAGSGSGGDLTVYAAASLRDVLKELADAYSADGGGRVTVSLGGSNALRVQIEQGAPADLFLSADAAQARQLAADGQVAGDPQPFTRASVALVVPAAGSRVKRWQDLASRGVTLIAAGAAVPIQRYAEQLIDRLAALPDAPPGYAAAVRGDIASREENVASVVARVELGEGDAAFVYTPDARSDRLRTLPLPAAARVDAEYLGAVVRGGREEAAAGFLGWLRGDEAQAIFARHGFTRL
jgi:molybdate transport system substrate-binding protein